MHNCFLDCLVISNKLRQYYLVSPIPNRQPLYFTFVLEEKVGNQDLLYGMPSKKSEFETVALMINLWKENLGTISYDDISKFASMSDHERISAIMKDERYRSRFPSILRNSKEIADNWRESNWQVTFIMTPHILGFIIRNLVGFTCNRPLTTTHGFTFPKLAGFGFLKVPRKIIQMGRHTMLTSRGQAGCGLIFMTQRMSGICITIFQRKFGKIILNKNICFRTF